MKDTTEVGKGRCAMSSSCIDRKGFVCHYLLCFDIPSGAREQRPEAPVNRLEEEERLSANSCPSMINGYLWQVPHRSRLEKEHYGGLRSDPSTLWVLASVYPSSINYLGRLQIRSGLKKQT